jgi:hypothetical protein
MRGNKGRGQTRTVEEVILRRRLEEMAIQQSKSTPMLRSDSNFLPVISNVPANNPKLIRTSTSPPKKYDIRTYSESDVRNMMENVMKYCLALQNRVEVIKRKEEKNK